VTLTASGFPASPLRVLVVGGGVAGLTLAAKLRQQGREATVVEKLPDYGDAGYGIGLYPLGSSVLHGLGAYDALRARGCEPSTYEIADERGEPLQDVDLSTLTGRTGPMVMVSRADLLEVLREACGGLRVRMGVTVGSLEQSDDDVRVRLSDGAEATFDLVVGCDGIRSDVRAYVAGPGRAFDTGWTLWTWWAREGSFSPDTVREYWGHGFFFGAYPVPGRCMVAAGLETAAVTSPHTPGEVRAALEAALQPLRERVPSVGEALAAAGDLYAWPMADVRSERWRRGRVALCGDAASAFLPTAGVGASEAMRSAAALADELSRADASLVPLALELYVKRCQRLVRESQEDSRRAARWMFVSSPAVGWARDRLVAHYPAARVIQHITESMHQPF
jgi:2-polyprenyl-6-methoxyphenol hydroxylase-like FAD-dependent oxidoreductase